MNGEASMVALSNLVARGAFAAKSPRAAERAARRWVGKLSTALRSKVGKAWHVSQDARLPGGQTVKAYLSCGAGPDRLAGFVVPPGALDCWNTKARQRFVDTHELLRRFDAFRAARPNITEDGCALLFAETPDGEWVREHGLSCDIGRIRQYRRRLNPADNLFDGNVDRRGRRKATEAEKAASCSPEAWDAFLALYLQNRQHSVTECHRIITAEAELRKWAWPSVREIQRRVRDDVSRGTKVYAREGLQRFRADCLPKIHRDYEGIPAGAHWCGDERTLDLFVRVLDCRKGWRPVRPKMTAWLDVRSRVFVGWVIGVLANSDTILAAFKQGAKAFGLPSEVTIDNGEDYRRVGGKRRRWDSFDDVRLGTNFERMCIKRHYAQAKTPYPKPVESAFRTLKEIDRHVPSFCGGSPGERPADIKEFAGDVMSLWTMDELIAFYEQGLAVYHATVHTGNGMHGLSPSLAMERFRGPIRTCDEATLNLLCSKLVGPRKVGRDGIRHNRLLFGQTEDAIIPLQGKEVYLLVDPERLDAVTVCNAQGEPLFVATNKRLSGATQQELREVMHRNSRLIKQEREYKASIMDKFQALPEQIMDLKRRKVEAAQAKTRESLPAVAEAPAVSIVRPDLHEAAKKIQKQSGFDRLAAKATEEANTTKQYRESVGAVYARLWGRAPKPEPAREVQAFDWATYEDRVKQAQASMDAALG